MAKKKAGTVYSGELAKPILHNPLFGSTSAGIESDHVFKERCRKILLLFEHYQIPLEEKNGWLLLAYKLAETHVPGLQVVNNKPAMGAPKKLDRERENLLLREINNRRDEGKSVPQICRKLINMPTFRSMADTPKTLETRYWKITKEREENSKIMFELLGTMQTGLVGFGGNNFNLTPHEDNPLAGGLMQPTKPRKWARKK